MNIVTGCHPPAPAQCKTGISAGLTCCHFHSSSVSTEVMQGAVYFSLSAFLKTTMLPIYSSSLLCSLDINIMLKSSNCCMFTNLNDKAWQKTAQLVLVFSMKLGECILLGKKVKSAKQLLRLQKNLGAKILKICCRVSLATCKQHLDFTSACTDYRDAFLKL